jgi:type I restriction enzyme, S subunit
MSAKDLLKHFDRIAEAPDAVAHLRRFILDLAVRGKLVEQDPNDEPASELLKRIQLEKEKLVKIGKNRKAKLIEPLKDEDCVFTLPKTWQWSQLAEIGIINPRNDADNESLASFVSMPLISAEYGTPHTHEIRTWGDIKSGYTHFAEGDVGLAKITPCFENGKSTVFRGLTGKIGSGTTELHIVRPLLINADYVLLFLKCPHFIHTGIPRMTGTAGQKRVPTEYFAYSPFPLPPLAEQHRIIAKVDELMGLCDRLQSAQQNRESQRDRLVAASLHHLNQSADGEFGDCARFYFNHLSELTVRSEHVKALRQTILNLAVRGKLVPQDPNDEPASGLLNKILDQKIINNTSKHSKERSKNINHDVNIRLPKTWKWVRTEDICEFIIDCPHSTPVFVPYGITCLDTNGFKNGKLIPYKIRYVSEETYLERVKRLIPQSGDVVFAREGSVGSSIIIPEGMKCCLGQRVMLFRLVQEVLPSYFSLALSEPSSLARLLSLHKGIGAKHVNVADMRNALIPLPPTSEQHRIIAKVDELMAQCDRLETQLTTTQTTSRQLLESLLHKALNPSV